MGKVNQMAATGKNRFAHLICKIIENHNRNVNRNINSSGNLIRKSNF